MFGLEDGGDGKKKKEDFVFDLEAEMKDMANFRATKELVEGKVASIKATLRSGGNKDAFDTLGVLLHGYTSVLKVITRASKAKKK